MFTAEEQPGETVVMEALLSGFAEMDLRKQEQEAERLHADRPDLLERQAPTAAHLLRGFGR
ncbi:MAG: hypothetical protein JO185_08885 [Acidobacteriaceae bacterium]|nr:hypothetical protein [Acidobacteriaceae bacterium]